MRRRRLLGVGAGLLAGAGCLTLTVRDASAFSQNRLLIHRAALAEVGTSFADPGGDVRMVVAVFQRAGVAAPVAAGVVARGGDATSLLTALCAPEDRRPAAPPAPGDLLQYLSEGRIRLALAVTEVEVLIRGDDGVAHVDLLRSLVGDDRVQGDVPRRGQAVGGCRLSAAVVPGADDLSVPPGRVALGDVAAALDHVDALASHPRDADVSWVHRITSSFSQVLGALLRLGSQLIGRIAGSWAQAVEWLHDRLGPAFYVSVFLVPWLCKRVLTATVDLRSLHAGLVWLGVVGLALTPLGAAVALTTAMFVGVGLVTGWWSARSLGALVATATWNTTVFGVDLLTGIDGTRPSSIAMVSFALATDILLFAKPVGVAFRVAELAGRWSWVGSAYLAVGRAADAALPVITKASGPIDFLKGLLVLQPSDCTRVVPRQGRLMTVVTRTLDVVTIPWRGASIAAPGPVIDGATGVGEWSAQHMALRVGGDPRTTELIRDAMKPGLRAVRDTYQIHGAARSTIAAVGGDGPPTWQPPAPRPPDDAWVRRVEAGLQRKD